MAAGVAAGHRPQAVFVRDDVAERLAEELNLAGGGSTNSTARPRSFVPPAVYPVTERVAAQISTLETPPTAMAVYPLPAPQSLSALADAADRDPLVLYIDGVGDPGNVGTLLRAAAAFGAAAVVAGPGSADLYGPKVVRASMGAIFGPALFTGLRLTDVAERLGAAGVYGLAAHGGAPLHEVEVRRPGVLVVGAERTGLSASALDALTALVTIPLAPLGAGAVESLNAGVAGAIALYEFSRRTSGSVPSQTGSRLEEG